MKEQKLVQFKINNKEFCFSIEEDIEVIEEIKNIISEVSKFVQQQNQGMFCLENFAYIIFILASNLVRANHQNKMTTTMVGEEGLQKKIIQMMERVSFLSNSIKGEKKI